MFSRLVIDGNAVYEIDEECLRRKQGKAPDKNMGNMSRQSRQGKGKERNE